MIENTFKAARVAAALDAVRELRARREALGRSQRQVGEAIGLTPKQAQRKVGQWERGDRPPSYAQLAAYAARRRLFAALPPER